MAYAVAYTVTTTTIDRITHRHYVVTETDVGTSSEWSVNVPSDRPLRLTDFCVEITDADAASTVQPELGLVSGWTTDAIGHLVQESAAAARILNDEDVRFRARDGSLYGRSAADAHADEIVTRFTIVEGH